jgi:hypothetical protein
MLLWAWVLAVVLYFSWEAVSYRGLSAFVAEWQFAHLGQDLPTFNFGVLTTLFALPALYLFRRRTSAVSGEADARPTDLTEAADARRDAEAGVDRARDYMHFLFGFALAMALGAVAALSWTLLLPRLDAAPRIVSIAAGDPGEGPAQLSGTVSYGRIASFSRGVLALRRTALYAPIVPPGGRDEPIRYFVEFLPTERADIRSGATITHRRGILVRNDLPGALRRLYNYLGYRTAPRYYVLYASSATIRWPYFVVAMQFAMGAFGFVVVALFQRRRLRSLERDARKLTARERRLTAGA